MLYSQQVQTKKKHKRQRDRDRRRERERNVTHRNHQNEIKSYKKSFHAVFTQRCSWCCLTCLWLWQRTIVSLRSVWVVGRCVCSPATRCHSVTAVYQSPVASRLSVPEIDGAGRQCDKVADCRRQHHGTSVSDKQPDWATQQRSTRSSSSSSSRAGRSQSAVRCLWLPW